MLKANALVFIVVIVLMATSFAVATSHVNHASSRGGSYLPSQPSSGSSSVKHYNLTLDEKGLPAGACWDVYFEQNGTFQTILSYNSTMVISALNGSHCIYLQNDSGNSYWYGYSGNFNNSGRSFGSVTINGGPKTVDVTYIRDYYINFTETGLPATNNWCVGVDNSVYSVTNSAYHPILEENGTWSYCFSTKMSGFYASPQSGTVTISGHNVTVASKFTTSSPGHYPLEFTESGLPTGMAWYVNLSNGDQSGAITGTSFSFSLLNGTYNYTVSTLSGYSTSQSSGSITVNGQSQYILITFTSTKPTPPPKWAFAGAYANYNIKGFAPIGKGNFTLQITILSVNDTNESIGVEMNAYNSTSNHLQYENISWSNFFPFMIDQQMLSDLNNASFANSHNVTTNVTVTTAGGKFLTDEVYSSYNGTVFRVYYDRNSGVLVLLNFSNSTSNATFELESTNIITTATHAYAIDFTESGLPSGTAWYVNLSNGMKSGAITGSSYSTSVTNGSYTYTISTGDKKYSPSPSSGSLTVNGASVSRAVKFSEVEYTVTFKESGLPSGTRWYVSLEDNSKSSTASAITFTVPNGTYTFGVDSSLNMSGYAPSSSSGYVTVNGANKIENISFSVPSTHPPVWAFKGAYANYTLNQTTKTSTEHGYIYFRIISVNNATQMVEIFTKAYNGTKTTTSYYNTSWNDVFFAYNQTVLSMLNNGTLPASFHGSKIKKDVTISTAMGTFTTDEINTTLNSSSAGYEVIYVDVKTGLLVSVSFSNSSGKVTAGIASSNILNANHKPSGSFSLSPMELYGAIGGVVAVVAVVSAISIIRKRR